MMQCTAVDRMSRPGAKSGRAAPQLLVLTHRVPFPPDKGDRIRTFHVIKYLSQFADRHVVCLADEPLHPQARETLRHYCKRVGVVPIEAATRRIRTGLSLFRGRTATEGVFSEPTLSSLLDAWARETRFHSVLISTSGLARYLETPGLRGLRAVVDMVDVDSEKWFDYARASRAPKSWLYRLEGSRLRRLEGEIAGWAQGVTLVSEAEARLFRSVVRNDRPIHAVTNGVDLEYFRPVPDAVSRPDTCVFVGALDYKPNIDGISWFCREVWPGVSDALPGARLSVVGRRPVPPVRRLANIPGVAVLGQVPDVRPFLAEARLVIVPLRMARGIQNKVLEAMAMGKAVIASPEAIDGLGADPTSDLVCARTAEEWVASVRSILVDADRRRRVMESARGFAVARHQWNSTLSPLLDVLRIGRN